jgi:hypothetical protein
MIRFFSICCFFLLLSAVPGSAQTDRSIPGKSKPHDAAARSERIDGHHQKQRDSGTRKMTKTPKTPDAAARSERVKEHTEQQRAPGKRDMTPKSKAHDAAARGERVEEHKKKQRDPEARKLPSGR